MGLDEVVVDAEEAFDAVEGSYFLHGVLIALRIGLFLAPVSPQIEEGEAAVEEVGHLAARGPLGALWLPLNAPRRRRGLQASARALGSFELSEQGRAVRRRGLPRERWMAFTGCLRNSWQRLAAEVASDELRAQNLRRLDNLASVD